MGLLTKRTKPRESPSAPGQGNDPAPLDHAAEHILAAKSKPILGVELVTDGVIVVGIGCVFVTVGGRVTVGIAVVGWLVGGTTAAVVAKLGGV
jgi:hypothetical protein